MWQYEMPYKDFDLFVTNQAIALIHQYEMSSLWNVKSILTLDTQLSYCCTLPLCVAHTVYNMSRIEEIHTSTLCHHMDHYQALHSHCTCAKL